MRNFLLLGTMCVCALSVSAQSFKEWQDPEVNAINRAPMHTSFFPYEDLEKANKGVKEESDNFMTLNGKWKFLWVENADQRPVDFFRVGYDDNGWDDFRIPAVWELNGYGDPIYVNIGYAWRNQYKNNPPYVPVEKGFLS